MNFKTIGLNAAFAATVVAGAALSVSPAQAITLGSSISFSGGANVTGDSIEFLTSKVDNASLSFSSLIGSTATKVQTLNFTPAIGLAPVAIRSTSTINHFIDFGTFTDGGSTGNLFFNLFSSPTVTFQSFVGVTHTTFADGAFEFNGKTLAGGFINASKAGTSGSYNISLVATAPTTPVPTPALLPGLLALGAGVLRKRKAEANEQVNADV